MPVRDEKNAQLTAARGALEASELRYRELVELAPIGIFRSTREGRFVSVNPALARILGYDSPDEMLQLDLRTDVYFDPDERDRRLAERGEGTGLAGFEVRWKRRDGSPLWVRLDSRVIRGESGAIELFEGFVHDIQKRKDAEDALRGSEERYRLLFEKNPEPMFVFDENTLAFLAVNDAAIRTYGYSAEEFLSMTIKEIRPAEDLRRLSEILSATRAGYADVRDVKHRKKDGSLVDVEIASQPLEFSGRQARLVLAKDVTERKRAEESVQKLQLAVEQAENVIFMTDPDGVITYVNPAFETVYGFPREKALGKTPRILKSGWYNQSFYEGFWQKLLAGESLRGEIVNKRRNDQLVTMEESVSPFLNAEGKRIGFIAVQVDITDRKQAEESFWESEQRYRSLFESMLHGYAYCEMLFEDGEPRDFVYLDVNRAFEELTGLKDVVGKRATDVIPGLRESNPELFQMYGRVALTGVPERFEIYVESLGVWFSISTYSPQRGHFVALFDNVTEQKRAQEALLQSEERFHRSFSSSPVAMTLAEVKTGLMIDVNERLAGMLGYAREELIGRSSLEMGLWVDPAERARVVADVEASIPIREREIRLRTKTGEVRYILDSIEPLQFGKERVLLSAFQDVTEKRSLEDQLRQAQKMEAVGQLAGGVAHDFNNLLTAILGYADLLASKLPSDSRLQEEIGEISGAGRRAAALTRQLLAFSRKQILEPVVLRPNELVANLEKMLRRVIGEHVQLVTRLQPAAGNVRADPGQLEQVIVNLAVNARDAMPEGGKLTIETADADLDEAYAQRHVAVRPGHYVMVAVSDTGTGMDAETQARIFEPFFTTKEKGKGTGLGLSTVYGIVKQSGGYIWVYSEPEKGTTFKVYLPRVDGTIPAAPLRSSDSLPALGTETILVVEDEPAIRTLSRQILERSGYHVLEARDGRSALELARTHPEPIHLLLTDLVMPDLPGTELATRLSARRPGLRVVFMSGYTDDKVVDSGLLESGRAFLQKPFTPAMLARKIRDVLSSEGPP